MNYLDSLVAEYDLYMDRISFFHANDDMYSALDDWIIAIECEIAEEVFKRRVEGGYISEGAQRICDELDNTVSDIEDGEYGTWLQ